LKKARERRSQTSFTNALLGAMGRHLVANNFTDEMRLDRHGVTARVRTRGDAKYQDRTPELIEALDLLSRSDNVFIDCFRLFAVRISHTTYIRDTKHTHDIALADGLAVDILDARWLGGGHGI
jgi:hypothetical protein